MTRKVAADSPTPASLGFRMPAEWEPHLATWIAWPHNRADWPGRFTPVPWVFAEFVKHLTCESPVSERPRERARILVNDAAGEANARRVLKRANCDLGQVDFYLYPTNRIWTRDYAPIFVKDKAGEVAITNWKFNAWAKYADHQLDDSIPGRLAERLKRREFICKGAAGRVVLEGGSIDVNGLGTLVTTEECLLSDVQARNPELGRQGTERALADYLGIQKVIWLKNGIAGDDTHGHVDDLARFVGPRTVVLCGESDREDANYGALLENRAILESATDQDGQPLQVVMLPMPAPVIFDGIRLPASYANFYIGNRAVLVPTFNDPQDRVALSILERLFPDRAVVGIHAVDLVWGLGTLHCMTQQEPLSL